MKKLMLMISALLCIGTVVRAQSVYIAQGAKVSFFSTTPVEDIDASSQSMTSVLNITNGEIAFTVPVSTLKFKKALMEEHFNEKYIESEKYPQASFKGKINETIDWTKEGTYEISSTGVFNIHGVDKPHIDKGKAVIKDGKITITSAFKVAIRDHNITVPKIVTANIAEIIDVKISADYVPYKKTK